MHINGRKDSDNVQGAPLMSFKRHAKLSCEFSHPQAFTALFSTISTTHATTLTITLYLSLSPGFTR